eukprot:scaffold5517_cov116-Isochrysis_galbana.AAC.2
MQTGGEADRRRSRGTTVVAALVTSAALFCVLFSLLTEDAFTAPALLSDSDEEEDCGGYMSFWLCPKVVDPNSARPGWQWTPGRLGSTGPQ